MYIEGTTKGILAILAAVLLVVALAFWPQTKFVARFLFDLVVMNSKIGFQNLLLSLQQYWEQHRHLVL
jgi:hypothetical protein